MMSEPVIEQELSMCNLEFQKIIEQKECYFKFYDDVLDYKVRFLAEEPLDREDQMSAKENVATYYRRHIPKRAIMSVDMDNVNNKKAEAKWMLTISVLGSQVDVKVYFAKYNDCLDLYKKCIKWAYGHDAE